MWRRGRIKINERTNNPEPVAAPATAPGRLGFVDGLRALAALYVVVGHISDTAWRMAPSDSQLLSAITVPFNTFGHLAVSLFIVLSGYSLTLPVARADFRLPHGAWSFYVRRARRVLPPYYLAMALSLALIWLAIGRRTNTVWDVTIPVTWRGVTTHLLLLQNLSATDHATINYVFWSIAMECQIYLIFPLLVLVWRRYHPLFAALMVCALSFASVGALALTWLGHLPSYGTNSIAPQYVGLFGLGMFAASIHTRPTHLWQRLARWHVWDAVSGGAVALLVTLAVWWWPLKNLLAWLTLDFITGAMAVGLLLAAEYPGRLNPIHATLSWRPLVWIGGFSYSLYLIHAPLIQVLWQYGLRPLGLSDLASYLLLLFGGVPLIVLAAWAFWWLCERPFLNSRSTPSPGVQRHDGVTIQMEATILRATRGE